MKPTTPLPPPPDQWGVHYFDRTQPKPCFVDEECVDLACACRRVAEVRKSVDADAYLERQTASGVWRRYPTSVVAS